ncbi:hypothetical protein D9M68_743840 [compost metagenome]
MTEVIFVQQAPTPVGRVAHYLEEGLVRRGDLLELLVSLGISCRFQAFLQGGTELSLGFLQRGRVQFLAHQVDHLVAQVLAQFLAGVDGGEGPIDQAFLGAGQLHHAEQTQQQTHQGHRDQRRDAQEQLSAQSHPGGPVHRP